MADLEQVGKGLAVAFCVTYGPLSVWGLEVLPVYAAALTFGASVLGLMFKRRADQKALKDRSQELRQAAEEWRALHAQGRY